jgi:regulator of replication initiation timing
MMTMANQYRTADTVADMEQEIEELRTELESVTRSLEIVTADRNRLQIENTLLDGKSREMLIKATRVETLLQNTAHLIVSGIKEFKEQREQIRAVRRHEQEAAFEDENRQDAPPAFLTHTGRVPAEMPATSNPPRAQRSIGMTEQEGQHLRGEALRGAAERIAEPRPVPPVPPGRVNTAIAQTDSRLPQNEWRTAEQQDADNLLDISEQMERRR